MDSQAKDWHAQRIVVPVSDRRMPSPRLFVGMSIMEGLMQTMTACNRYGCMRRFRARIEQVEEVQQTVNYMKLETCVVS